MNSVIFTTAACPDLGQIGNGSIAIYPGWPMQVGLGTKANYTCNSGYSLRGAVTRHCVYGSGEKVNIGIWNGSAPICKGKEFFPLQF